MSSYARAMSLGRPTPVHALTPEAADAVEAVRRHGYARRMRRLADTLVTDHGRPHRAPYRGGIPANARKLEALAAAHGMRAQIVEVTDRCTVEGIHTARGVAFRATWTRGRADLATWHERTTRYDMVRDVRPVGVHKTAFVGLAGKRSPGVSEIHLRIVATPLGVKLSFVELNEKVSAL